MLASIRIVIGGVMTLFWLFLSVIWAIGWPRIIFGEAWDRVVAFVLVLLAVEEAMKTWKVYKTTREPVEEDRY